MEAFVRDYLENINNPKPDLRILPQGEALTEDEEREVADWQARFRRGETKGEIAPRSVWVKYDQEKNRIAVGLSHDEYDKAVDKILDELGL